MASGAMMSTVRAPASVRANTSRPRSSVPNQWAALGAFKVAKALTTFGSCVRDLEKRAMTIQKSTMMSPVMNVGLRSRPFAR